MVERNKLEGDNGIGLSDGHKLRIELEVRLTVGTLANAYLYIVSG